ncbi:MAG: recombination protein U [Bacilli bacterium]|nr:recombination protein U [Bacilli bacterium]
MISANYFKKHIKNNNYANRGMILEKDINISNEYYLINNIALIYKKPTPIKVIRVEYPKNVITEAYFNEPSTLDYNGIYKGKYIEFDAKETNSKTSFPIANVHKHQIEHIKKVLYFGGIPFLIVRFNLLNKTYILLGEDFLDFLNNNKRKSIPLEYFKLKGFFVELKYTPRLDYLKIIDNLLK